MKYYSTNEILNHFKIGESTLYSWIRKGLIDAPISDPNDRNRNLYSASIYQQIKKIVTLKSNQNQNHSVTPTRQEGDE